MKKLGEPIGRAVHNADAGMEVNLLTDHGGHRVVLAAEDVLANVYIAADEQGYGFMVKSITTWHRVNEVEA